MLMCLHTERHPKRHVTDLVRDNHLTKQVQQYKSLVPGVIFMAKSQLVWFRKLLSKHDQEHKAEKGSRHH